MHKPLFSMLFCGNGRVLCFFFSYEETEAQEITFPDLEPSAMFLRSYLQLGDNSEPNRFCMAGFFMVALPRSYL